MPSYFASQIPTGMSPALARYAQKVAKPKIWKKTLLQRLTGTPYPIYCNVEKPFLIAALIWWAGMFYWHQQIIETYPKNAPQPWYLKNQSVAQLEKYKKMDEAEGLILPNTKKETEKINFE